MHNSQANDTVELPAGTLEAGADRSFSASARVELAGLSHPGRVRPNNEDHFLICRFGRFLETLQTNVPEGEIPTRVDEIGYGMLVADGVGGGAAGEVASKLAISTLVHLVLQTPDWFLRVEQDAWMQEVMRRTTERYEQVNAALTEQARADPDLRGFATTLTLAGSLGRQLLVANVGDSRAYLLRNGQLRLLTRDHTMAQALAQAGLIPPEQLATHRMRHVLLKALGDPTRQVEPDVHEHTLEEGDCLLVCSDGLTDMVDEKLIAKILASGEPAKQICERLVDEALRAGGKDNVTTVFARYSFD
ncbi:MAG TPA: protein phosphatase 2C domain-containing protein [Candidatus Solibacter sp.]|nr:protein phosphatase 2C domain-containing protein [Candidatus Solibacter sp.]